MLARQLVPAALPVFIDQQDRAALTHLARHAGLPLPTLLRQHGHHAVAKHVFEGAHYLDSINPNYLMKSQPTVCCWLQTFWASSRHGMRCRKQRQFCQF